jgi:hypothetical protein
MISSRENEIAPPLEQHAEHVERARTGFDRRGSGLSIHHEQAAPIETEPIEEKNLACGEHFHASALPVSEFENILAQFRTF